jgi:DNA invertase Pin-like site-specific DNA recombinase
MLAHDDSITQDLALTVEREARAEWGGQRIDYIATHCGDRKASRKPLAIDVQKAAHAAGLTNVPTQQVIEKYGMSRATLYRLMKRGPADTGDVG